MPSFLSKVFGRKKDDTLKTDAPQKRPSSDASLLEGKFEAVPKVLSPTSPRFDVPPQVPTNGKESDGVGLFKNKSIRNQSVAHGRELDYHLSLNLPGPKEESSRALGVVFEADPDAQLLLPESVIAERRLSPLEAFLLVQACSQVITSRGLETLGIMIPHWYSASPSVQRKLISLFVQSLALKSPITTLSPTASSPVSAFESEISTTRSPHDVAAVLRWGLRHLQLDGTSFGKDDQWYTQFLNSEKSSEYPPRAFTEKLAPLLPPAHLHLLTAVLEIFSSLAAHSEANSISGSKLSKMLGLWILSTPRVVEGDDVLTFYAQWEKWGRILEHLFLARIRDEAADHRMPTRLVELVKHYPYAKTASPDADPTFLPSPRFSTRRYDALYVGVETEISSNESKKHKNHPLRLIADALKASTKSRPSTPLAGANGHTSSEVELWESLKKYVSVADADSESYPGLSSLFADETIRFLSLIPTTDLEIKATEHEPFKLFIPESKVGRRRSMSLGDRDAAVAAAAVAAANNAHSKAASSSTSDAHGTSATSSEEPLAIDWNQFSTSGFFSENGSIGSKLASTLLDNKDVEVTIPRKLSSKRKLPPALIPLPSSRGKSLDLSPVKDTESEKEIKQGKSRATRFEIVQLDEAFIDFWSDALLDPISGDWPGFVVCKIKSSVPAVNGADNKRVGWLIIEQRFVTLKPSAPAIVTATTPEKEHAARPRPNSPKPSFASDSKSTKKNRFSFFTSISSSSISSSSTARTDRTKDKKKAGKGPKVGEMGEILKEEEEPSVSTSAKSNGVSTTEVAAVATAGVAAGLAAAVATALPETPKHEEAAPATLVEDATNTQVAPTPAADESQPKVAADVTSSLVEDVAEVQVAEPTKPAPRADAAAVPAPVLAEAEPAAPPPVEAEPTAPVVEAPLVPEDIPHAEPAPVVEPEPAAETQPAAEEAARLEAERIAETQRLQAEAERERVAAEEAVVAQQKAAEESARLEAERLAEEQRARAEQERIAAEEAAKAKAEAERLAAEEAERARVEAERLAEEERARLEEERLAEERRVQAEKERIAAEEAAQVLLAQQKAEEERIAAEGAERARLEAERLAEEEQVRREEERLAEERRIQAEKERIAAEEAAAALLAKQKAEEERARLEAERIAAEEAERARIAAEEAERARIAAEEAERARLEEEARLAKEKAEEEERARLEAERIAAEEAALAKQKAEEEERARLEAERLAAEEAERERLAAEEAERARLERERLEEEERLAREKAEEEERARLEAERIAAAEAERERLAAEEAERVRLEEARLAEERRVQEEKERIAAEEAALAKQKAEEEERARLEAERIAAEEAAIAKQKAEEEAARLEAPEEAERARLAAEEAERARIAAEEAERARLEEEAERARIAAEEAERARLEEEARLKAEEEERARAEAERIAAEEAALAKAKAEEEERARLEAERIAAEEAERERLAAEEAERARLERERLEEEERVAKEKAEEEERARLEAERIAAEEAERERLAAEEAERVRLEEERLAEERRAQEEKERLAAEEAALAKQKAEEERARVEAEEAERERVAAEEAERERQAAQQAEQERLEKERLEAEAAASPPAQSGPEVMVVNDEPVAVAPEEPAPRAATPVEEAQSAQIAPEAPSSDGGLQFDTSAEVIGVGHVEPLREPEAANDALVDLPAVPVVEARPDLVRGTTAISHLELTPSPDEHGEAAGTAVDGMLPGGETVGPQAALSIADESVTELKHAEETNGNDTNGHSPEDAEAPAE